jgi:cytochrome b
MESKVYRTYQVWDAPTRIFHWVNAFSVIFLVFTGLLFTFRKQFGLEGEEANIALELGFVKLHSIIGYVFTVNLMIRIVWAFIGNSYARWHSFLPSKSTMQALGPYINSLRSGHPQQYIGHNPAGRLAITAMLLLLVILAVTGLIRAGSDLYYPPFGGVYAEYIAKPGVDPDTLLAGDNSGVSPEKYQKVRSSLFLMGSIHKYFSYLLIVIATFHIFAIMVSEKRENGLISAMISGKKIVVEARSKGDQRSGD